MRRVRWKFVLSACVVLGTQAINIISATADEVGDSMKQAHAALKSKDYDIAFREFSKAYAKGSAFAPHYLGVLYLNGQGVAADYGRAQSLLQEALKHKDNWRAACALAYMREQGKGVSVDRDQAFKYYMKALEMSEKSALDSREECFASMLYAIRQMSFSGKAEANYWLARLLEEGIGVGKDKVQALTLYQRANNGGFTPAGRGVSRLESYFEVKEYVKICNVKALCEEYGKVQQDCAAAGDIGKCVQIKYAGRPTPYQCKQDGSGQINYVNQSIVPNKVGCAYYFAQDVINEKF